MAQKLEVQAIVENLIKEKENTTMEGELLQRKMIRQLYKLLGDPTEKDFPEECKTAGSYWTKQEGYTKDIEIEHECCMENSNREVTNWHIERASGTKMRIVEEYTRAGWHCEVQSYNVICTKYAKHPRYENIWVRFYSSRECNKYEYVIEEK